jgi:hypothetical protein
MDHDYALYKIHPNIHKKPFPTPISPPEVFTINNMVAIHVSITVLKYEVKKEAYLRKIPEPYDKIFLCFFYCIKTNVVGKIF